MEAGIVVIVEHEMMKDMSLPWRLVIPQKRHLKELYANVCRWFRVRPHHRASGLVGLSYPYRFALVCRPTLIQLSKVAIPCLTDERVELQWFEVDWR